MAASIDTIRMYQSDSKPCPYLEGRQSQSHFFFIDELDPQTYEALMAQNWRRSGRCVYRPNCESCSLCMQMRVDVAEFTESKSQRRCVRMNQDLRVEVSEDLGADDALDLYTRYQLVWHQTAAVPDRDEVREFLASSPVSTVLMRYTLAEKLIGVGWVDVLASGLSSVYFAFDPDYSARRLGVFSLLQEIRLARRLGLSWIYLGYWVAGSPKMQYKADYLPHEIVVDGSWQRRQRP